MKKQKQRSIQAPESYDHLRQYLTPEEFEKIDREFRGRGKSGKPLPAVPRFELTPGYMNAREAAAFFDKLSDLPNYKFETGSCIEDACHLTVQYGPRQMYNACVPEEFRVTSSGPMPDFLAAECARLEEKYDCTFNSCQINRHPDDQSHVFEHRDSNPGHICQISVGAARIFELSYGSPIFVKFAHVPLTSGSLLTFFPRDQFLMMHAMKRHPEPCGMKFSVIYRYIPVILTKTFIKNAATDAEKRRIRRERDEEYQAAQAAGRKARGTARPQIFDCHAGKKWPDGSVYVGREVRSRQTGDVTWPWTPYGNHKKLSGDAWAAEVARLMSNAEFAAKMYEDLAGRNLLCWCKPGEPNCHAKRWLELANA